MRSCVKLTADSAGKVVVEAILVHCSVGRKGKLGVAQPGL